MSLKVVLFGKYLKVSYLIRSDLHDRGQTIPEGDEDKDGNGHGTHVA